MNVLPFDLKVRVIAGLVECGGVRSTERNIAEVSGRGPTRVTILRLLLEVGDGCRRIHDRLFRDLQCGTLQLDEQHSIVFKKTKNLKPTDGDDVGEQWTWVAFDTSSRAVIVYLVGKRTGENARALAREVKARVPGRPTIHTDGYKPYVDAIDLAFGADVDFGMLVKMYAEDLPEDGARPNYKGAVPVRIAGDPGRIGTSLVERQNGTNRVFNKRLVRRTLCFSKSLPHHKAQVALSYFHYNFCHVLRTTRVTPAMALGLTDHVWSVAELVQAALAEPAAPAAPALPPDDPRPGQLALAGMPRLRLIQGGRT